MQFSTSRTSYFLTVVIPTYNSEKTLGRCLQSLIQQKTKNAFQIVIMDSSSEDATIEIIHSFDFGSRLILVSEKDRGIYDAMNKGVRQAEGEWIYFLGSDDYLVNDDVLENVFKYCSKYPNCDMLYGDVKWGDTGELYYGEFNFQKILYHNICHQSIFTKKSTLLKENLFDLNYPVYADWKMNFIFFKKKYRVKYIPLTIAYFNLGGVSTNPANDDFCNILEVERIKYHSLLTTKMKFYVLIGWNKLKRLASILKR